MKEWKGRFPDFVFEMERKVYESKYDDTVGLNTNVGLCNVFLRRKLQGRPLYFQCCCNHKESWGLLWYE